MTSHFIFNYVDRKGKKREYRNYEDHNPGAVATAIGKAARTFWKLQTRAARNDIRNSISPMTITIYIK